MTCKILSLIMALLLAAVSLVSCANVHETTGAADTAAEGTSDTVAETSDTADTSADTAAELYIPVHDENADAVSVYTENYSLSNAHIGYVIQSTYQSLLTNIDSYYGGDYSVLGLDISKPLKEQEYSFDEGYDTWYDYFEESALDTMSQVTSLCEAAKAAGYTLPDEAQEEIDDMFERYLAYAEGEDMTIDEYVAKSFGADVTAEIMKDIVSMSYTAQYYLNDVLSNLDLSDGALEAAYQEDPDVADRVDYLLFPFDYAELIPEDADEAAVEEAKNTCRSAASEVAKATDEDSFKAALVKRLTEDFGYTEEDAEAETDTILYEDAVYSDDPVLDWMFDAEAGESGVIEDENYGVVYACYLVERKGRDETAALRDVRHILFTHDSYEDDTTVRQVYNDWVDAGATVEDFIALAAEYSEDPGSATNGGLYEEVYEGQMVDEFNDWLFDEARVEGDHAIVESASYGWHIMYYEGGGEPAWKDTVKGYLQAELQSRTLEDAMTKYAVTVDEEVLASLPA